MLMDGVEERVEPELLELLWNYSSVCQSCDWSPSILLSHPAEDDRSLAREGTLCCKGGEVSQVPPRACSASCRSPKIFAAVRPLPPFNTHFPG